MATRNFYVSANIQGRETILGGGPQSKEGGLSLIFTQRDDGEVVTAFTAQSFENNGYLTTILRDSEDKEIYRFKTKR